MNEINMNRGILILAIILALAVTSACQSPAIELKGHESSVTSVAFSPNGKLLASGCADKTIRLWNVTDPISNPIILSGHEGCVQDITFSPDGKMIASVSDDLTIRLWDVDNLSDPAVILTDQLKNNIGHELVFSADGKTIAFSEAISDGGVPRREIAFSGTPRIILEWEVANLGAEPRIILEDTEVIAYDIVFSPDRHTLASCGNNNIRLWDLNNLNAGPTIIFIRETPILSCDFTPDGKVLASSARSNIYLWDVTNLAVAPIRLQEVHMGTIGIVAFSPNGQLLVSAGFFSDEPIRIWDVNNPEANPLVIQGAFAADLAFSPDSQMLVTAGKDGIIRVWDLQEMLND